MVKNTKQGTDPMSNWHTEDTREFTAAIHKPRVEFYIVRDDAEDAYRLHFYTYDIDGGDGTQGRDMEVDMSFVSQSEAEEFASVMI